MKNVTYINAGAGSGKTTELTKILAKKLEKEVKPSEVILTTFTEMAAAEFRERARQKLYQSGQADIANQLDAATIGTVHSVAFSFIKKYWYLIGVSPDMKVMSEEDLQVYISQSLGDYVSQEDLDFFRQYCEFFNLRGSDNTSIDYNFWINALLIVIDKINTYNVDLKESKNQSTKLIKKLFSASATPLKTDLITKYTIILEQNKDAYATTVKPKAEKLIKGLKAPILSYAILSDLYKEGGTETAIGQANRDAIKADIEGNSFDEMITNLKSYLLSYDENNSNCPGNLIVKMTETIFDIAGKWKEGFEDFKKRRHIIDYNDMERYFLDLLRDENVRKEIEGNYKLLMVDEFQDSSPIQLEIFQLLSEMVKCSYWVGDPKQSIYGFRGTDVSLVNELVGFFRDDNYKNEHSLNLDSLEFSYRTRPSLVELANDCFIRAFDGVMNPKDIHLTSKRTDNEELGAPLSHWNCGKAKDVTLYNKVADRIAILMANKPKVIDKDTKQIRTLRYGDIAILCRENKECASYAKSLSQRSIPVSFVNDDISQQIEIHLVVSLLQMMVDSSNKHIRANLLRLLKDQGTTEILNSRLDYIFQQNKERLEKEIPKDEIMPDEWMENDSLIGKLKTFVKAGRDFSVSDLVENIIYGLSLPEIVAKWGEKDIRKQNLSTVCALAKQYDNHCQQMGIGASVGGFITYLSYAKLESKVDNSADAVKVLTYHKSKGLEWNYVILDSLSDDSLEDKYFARKEFWGVREIRKASDKILSNEYLIQYLPRITSTSGTNLPTPILAKCMEEESWKTLKAREKRELCHLLYVGVTRARDYLTTVSKQTSKDKLPELSWIKNTGISLGKISKNASELWGYKGLLPIYEDITTAPDADQTKASVYQYYEYPELTLSDRVPKYLSPSKLPEIEVTKENVKILAELECRIKSYSPKTDEEAAAGTCIHNIFAVYDPTLSREKNVEKATSIRDGNNMRDIIEIPEEVIISIEKLYQYLTETYKQPPYAIKHEVPFIQPLPGQIVNGEIDLLWYLNENECVLIDFKNFPGTKATITTPGENNEHYAGKYAAQLKAYREVLLASGLTVRDTLIYYSVMGCVVRINL